MEKFYLTTSIAYVNSAPHLGFALELVQADCIARFQREILKKEVFFLTGTDEHGIKNYKKALEQGISPQEFVDKNSSLFKELTLKLNISNDDFIRTTDKNKHWPGVIKLWGLLESSGDIYKKAYRGLYCSGCEGFILERELQEGKCPLHQIEPEVLEEENYFFRLSRYKDFLKKIILKEEIKIIPASKKEELLVLIEEGLEDVSFSRPKSKLPWGVPVPGDDSQVIYVWADALTNYLTGIGFGRNEETFEKFWPANLHLIGKDIVKFHCLYWPAMLKSANLPLPQKILVHGFITVGGRKMSKSLGNVVDPFELIANYGADAVRYFLLKEIPPTEDGDFTSEKFEKRYQGDLVEGIGNFVARILALALKFAKEIKRVKNLDPKILAKLEESLNLTKENLESFKFNLALESLWNFFHFGDEVVDKSRLWEGKEEDLVKIRSFLESLAEIALYLSPFLPETALKLKSALNPEKGFEVKEKIHLFEKI